MFDAARAARAAVLGLGRYDGLWPSSEGEPTERDVAMLKVSTTQAFSALNPAMPVRCSGSGYVRGFDDDWPCGGCAKCAPRATWAWAMGVALWKLAHYEKHAEFAAALAGFEALAALGRAVAEAGEVGASIALFLGDTVAEHNTVRKGRWYKVTGKRGKAKEFFGLAGECVWVGEVESGPARPSHWRGSWTRSTTLRAKIVPAGGEGVGEKGGFYVPASCLSPVTPPPGAVEKMKAKELELARKAVRPAFNGRTGKRGDKGLIVEGKYAGKSGTVFWKSPDGKRVGVDVGASEPAWCSAHDVVAPASRFNVGYSVTERDAAVAGAEACMLALAAAGFDAAAEEYGALARALVAAA